MLWNVAISWHATSGSIIWGGPIEQDYNYRFFELRIENSGLGEVHARVFAKDIRDRHGKRIPRIDSGIELHWRGMCGDQRPILFGNRHGMAAFLQVDVGVPDKPTLLLVLPHTEPAKFALVSLLNEFATFPLAQQQTVYLTLLVEFYRMDGNSYVVEKNKSIVLKIIPDSTEPMCYRIRRTRWT